KVIDFAALVDQPSLKFTLVSSGLTNTLLKPGETQNVAVKLKNTGNLTWRNSGTNALSLRKSGESSLNSNRTLAKLKESEVKPGGTGTFEFSIKAPSGAGRYALYFLPEMANSNAILSSAGSLSVEVSGSTEDASLLSNNADLTFEPGQNRALNLSIQNTSRSTWKKTGEGALEIQLVKPSSVIVTTPRLSVVSLLPGRSARINFSVTAPQTPGSYTLEFRPRLNGKNLTNSPFKLTIVVEGSEETENDSTSSTLPTYEDAIRIKLTPDNANDPLLTSAAAFALYDNDKLIKNFSANSRVRAVKSGTAFKVTSGENAWTLNGPLRFVPAGEGVMKVLTMDQRPAWNLTLNDNEFRGTMEVRQISGITTLINELALEDYLKGIGEVSNGDPKEKIKTIITLARSYATYYMTVDEKFPGQPYDLDDDPNTSQKYLGYGYEKRSPNTAAAVTETSGMVVTYDGKVVKTPYFSKSDGVATKNAKDVWGWTTTPWLVSVSDTLCSSTSFEGHGVGLSGCGATEMAEQGDSYIDIINYYYKGVEVKAL
ncbi:MAG: SpoIID/LytB domain-containing protein, partial [Patescibacteria group bacterium]